ncbi:MAG: DUF1329 domain-containing protein [Thermodesulfobacteriota bacterium]|nr:DUF1329 domain-containing protein [Thermodesulfobacteriota bacterium]
MRTIRTSISSGLITVFICLLIILVYPGLLKGEGIPSVEAVLRGDAKLPTVEALTHGKVKVGDLIDKDNMGLVKDYLTTGTIVAIERGLVLRMGRQLPPDQLVPKYFRDITEKNRGKAIMDENGTVYYEKVGTLWPGGVPFVEPKTGLEVAANVKYGVVWDDLRNHPVRILFVDSKGKAYKRVDQDQKFVYCNTRTKEPPLGAVPGYEKVMFKRFLVITFPLELKGIGQYVVRHYDDAKYYDAGFAYLPAFKRTIRISATTWQDNIAGSDVTHSDGQGLSDPYSEWSFRLMGSRYIMMPEPKSPIAYVDDNWEISKELRFDVGKKFPRVGWAVWPLHVLEATPKLKHLYGKKLLYTSAWPYWPAILPWGLLDLYDRQMKLWKVYISIRGHHYIHEGEPYASSYMQYLWDIQADHMSQFWMSSALNQLKYKPEDITIRTLLSVGR